MTSRILPALASLILSAAAIVAFAAAGNDKAQPASGASSTADEPHRSPISLAVSTAGDRLLSANQTAGSVSLVDLKNGRVLDELKTGDKPAGVALSRDGHRGVVTHWYGYDLAVLDIKDDKLSIAGRVEVGPEPRGAAISADGSTAYVAIGVENKVVRVDLHIRKITGTLDVGREPRGVALSLDGSLLLVSNARSQDVSVIDVRSWKVSKTIPIDGDNLPKWQSAPTAKPATSPT